MPTPAAPTTTNLAAQDSDVEPADVCDEPEADTDADVGSTEDTDHAAQPSRRERFRPHATPPRLALLLGLTVAVALAAVIGVLGMRAHHAQQSAELRALYLQAGRQGALNLTTIDWQHADADVQRILEVATGPFYDDFSLRAQPFVDVVKKVQSVSTGTVTVAGVESSTDTDAQILVAVSVQTTTNEASQPTARAWRMRLSVHKVGDDAKVSNVEFVP